MATKASSKTATRKPAASAAGRKITAPQKPAHVAPKAKVPKKGLAAPAEPTAPAKQLKSQPEKPDVSQQATPHRETVSLIDRKRPAKKSQDGEVKTKRTVLPPISRIRASLEATSKPPPPAHIPPPEPPPAETAEQPPAEVTLTPAEVETEPQQKVLLIKPPIIVKQFATELALKPHQLIAELMTHNIFANINQTIEPDIAAKIAEKHGFILEKERREKGAGVHKVEQQVVAPPPPVIEKKEELKPRAPIITFMGHVDHGKTSLLDAIRKTRVAFGEAGGITQHIGAYSVDHNGHKITFIDTPGHAAFTAMRARGANVTDIVVLVVAADDGIMPQTAEAINHAKAAPHVKIMVAANKMDLPGANLDRLKKQLQDHGLTPEDWGGETIICPVSATKGTGIDQLLEMMTLQAEVMELKASPTARPRGTVIEAQVEAGRGPTATIIVQMGTLKIGDPFICGDYSGKVKSLLDDRGKPVKQVAPSTPVKVLGFTGLPNAGDEFLVMESERGTKQLSDERLETKRTNKLYVPQRATLETLLETAGGKKRVAYRFESRHARFRRSNHQRVEANREQKNRSGNYSFGRRTDFGIGHSVGECIRRSGHRFQREGRVHGGSGRKTRRRAGQALQHHLRAARSNQRRHGRPAGPGIARNRHWTRRSETGIPVEQRHRRWLPRDRWSDCSDGARSYFAKAPTGLRRRDFYATPFPGRRERSPFRSGMRNQAGRLQRISGGRHNRVLSTRANRPKIVMPVIPSEVEESRCETEI